MVSAGATSGVVAPDIAHTSDASLDAATVVLQPVAQAGAGAVSGRPDQHGAGRPRVGGVAIRRHLMRTKAHSRLGRTEDRLGRLHVAVPDQHRIDQAAVRSNARYRWFRQPWIFRSVSSICRLMPQRRGVLCRCLRSASPITGSSFASGSRTASRLTSIPRGATILLKPRSVSRQRGRRAPRAVTSQRSDTAAEPQQT